ncbi:host specificity factor TipJ family phage tail protein [Thiothrix nivea]|uniref:Tip attachment protein J HDII-ins2 domain-containing protein n=1 Tax=Thiothrix nivea (strain ATCC 35100 / DSM 5205 / JP2) TaxID=870187 RepID=A0A656H956_THINJ|nr:host specificity factor TipJ family phage tail protein [Thiothrix nivea]EIJ33311.1 hypothetical protein Thini_0674 [Thiothrix nivea DSM 5205]
MPVIYESRNPLGDINAATAHEVMVGATPMGWYQQQPDLDGKVVICFINQVPVMRAEWSSALGSGDVALFVVLPRGGNSNPLRLILMLAVMTFAAWAVGPAGLGLNGLAAAGVKLGITMVGSMLVNQIMPTPALPSTQQTPEPSPTYSLRGQSNMARLGQPIPAHYGRHIIWPDLISRPYYEYEADEQWYNIICCAGWGKISAELWKFGDIDIMAMPAADVQYQIAYPGQQITIIPNTVYTSADLAGTELTDVASASSYANPPSSVVTQLAVDIAFNGLGYINNSGGVDSRTVSIEIQAQRVDDAGTALGSWTTLKTEVFTAGTVDTIRRTVKMTVAAGRYAVHLRRTTAKSTDTRTRDAAIWGGLRGYDFSPRNYGDVTLVACRIKATKVLSEQSLQQLNFVGTRWLQKWTGSAWAALAASRSIVWAFADLYLSANAGRQTADTLLLAELKTLDAQLDALGHYFDYRFDQGGMKLGEAMQIAARAGRSLMFQSSGYWRMVRDKTQTTPVQMFTADNIKDFHVDIQAPQDYEPDALVGQFIDSDTWQTDTLTYTEVASPVNPENVDFPGITGRTHAWSELVYLWRANRRRETGYLVTGMEGRIPTLYDLVAVCPDGINWGYWGILYSNTSISNPLPFSSGKMMLRNSTGGTMGVYSITVTGGGYTVSGLPAQTYNNEKEPIYYIAGETTADIINCRVTGVKPQDNDMVRIDFVVEDSNVYATDPDAPPAPVDNGGGIIGDVLDLPWFRSSVSPDGDKYAVNLTWGAVNAASSYVVDARPDTSSAWSRIFADAKLACTHSVTAGVWHYRAAAISGQAGPYSLLDVTVGSDAITLPPPAAAIESAWTGAVLRIKWTLVAGAAKYRVIVYDTATMTARRTRDVVGDNWQYTYQDATDDGGPWRALTIRVWSLDATGNLSATYSTVVASNPQAAALTGIAVTAFAGVVSITYTWPTGTDMAGVLVYMSPTSGFTPSAATLKYDGQDAVIGIPVTYGSTWYVKVAAYDLWGKDSLTYSSQYAVTAALINPVDLVDGLEPVQIVTSLPAVGTWTGSKVISLNGVLYQLINGAWEPMVDAGKLSGQINPQQLVDGLEPVQIVTSLPAVGTWTGSKVISLNGVLYQIISGAWTPLVDASKLSGMITATQITDGAISTPKLAANAVTANELAANSVIAAKIQAGAISADKIAANAISSDKIAANAITATKIAAGVVTAGALATDSVIAAKIQAGAISADKIAANAIATDKLMANAVTSDKISVSQLSAISAAMGVVTTGKMQNASGRAVFNLDASGSTNFIQFKNAAGDSLFNVNADGKCGFTGALGIRDPESGLQLFAVGQQSDYQSYITDAQNPTTANGSVAFVGPSSHAAHPVARRCRSSTFPGYNGQNLTILVTATAVVDHHFSLWYAYYNENVWRHLVGTYDPVGGDGSVTLTHVASLSLANNDALLFCCTSSDSAKAVYDSGKKYLRNLSISAAAVNI